MRKRAIQQIRMASITVLTDISFPWDTSSRQRFSNLRIGLEIGGSKSLDPIYPPLRFRLQRIETRTDIRYVVIPTAFRKEIGRLSWTIPLCELDIALDISGRFAVNAFGVATRENYPSLIKLLGLLLIAVIEIIHSSWSFADTTASIFRILSFSYLIYLFLSLGIF